MSLTATRALWVVVLVAALAVVALGLHGRLAAALVALVAFTAAVYVVSLGALPA